MRALIYCFALSFICGSCSSKQNNIPIVGIYTTYKPGILEQVRLERRFGGHIFPLPAAMIYLRSDSTYVMGFCDNQVREAGRYFCSGDSIQLYERYSLDEKVKIEHRTMAYDSKNGMVYFTKPDTSSAIKRLSNRIIPLKKDYDYAHVGFLRGQNMSLDSLIHYYQQRTVEEQSAWTDSVLKAQQK
ncbi:hypothetical protein ACTHGU_07430 [Chitinophagaceae bacterium MMS25-I14]